MNKEGSHGATLIFFIDGLGWEALQRYPWFLQEIAPYRKGLTTILGYSSACDPSILTGKKPQEHGLWSSYFFSPETSPFKWLSFLKWLPRKVYDNRCMNAWRVRTKLSKIVAWVSGLKGYFELYAVPLNCLPFFDFAEKKELWAPQGVPGSVSIFDLIVAHNLPFYAQFGTAEEVQFQEVKKRLTAGEMGIYFLQLGKVDALLHKEGPFSSQLADLLKSYQEKIGDLYKSSGGEIGRCIFFSDHGMREVVATHIVSPPAEQFFLDSTMCRVWTRNSSEKQLVLDYFKKATFGSILSEEEQEEYGILFPDKKYGDIIFLLHPGHVISPSYMGATVPKGMHGYTPADSFSDAMVLSDRPIPQVCSEIQHLYELIKERVLEVALQAPPTGESPLEFEEK